MASVYKSLSKSNSKKPDAPSNGVKKNKQRVLILSSRGVTYRHRHLLNDLASMIPHGRKDAKFDTKKSGRLFELNELAEIQNCNNCMFFEARKGQDLYLHVSAVPNGSCVKMLVQNIHTADELNFTGNCLKGSRPILSFDATFEKEPHLRVIRELFHRVFGVPQGARKSKPFIDHVMSFSIVDGKIWVRNYQINEEEVAKTEAAKVENSKDTEMSLIEIGPRFTLQPIIIQEGSFGGPIIYQNKQFVSPNQIRSDLRRAKAHRHDARSEQIAKGLSKRQDLGLSSNGVRREKDELDTQTLFS